MTLSDAEIAFYQQVLNDPNKSKYSLNDLRYAYYLAALSGAVGSGLGVNDWMPTIGVNAPVGGYQQAWKFAGRGPNFGPDPNFAYAIPFLPLSTFSADTLHAYVDAASAGATTMWAIYDTNSAGTLPNALVQDLGSLSMSAAGAAATTPAVSFTFQANKPYWIAVRGGATSGGQLWGLSNSGAQGFATSLSDAITSTGRSYANMFINTAGQPWPATWVNGTSTPSSFPPVAFHRTA